MQGRKLVEVPELHAGDLGVVAKLRVTQTGDTLGVKGHGLRIDPLPAPEPAMTYAIEPKSRADEDKLAPALHKLMEEDLQLRFYRDPQTNDFLLAGAGQLHIEAVVSKLAAAITPKSRSNPPRSPTAKPSAPPPPATAATRSRAAATASSATARSASNPSRAAPASSS